ncbi:hypothetical protein H696_02667 [Fonticula alba]|uniref:EF-hand domain-containing protein n=1 Tax=Fonticula alba TaxID=691883 RepID=A0A058Z7T4_FONAL|nr:hypothetical protein H696_02667 [Fonticula alba]KCV70340.1 hypothetical protein H696_02667 [Fonticula alba]|eukprot:XP_009494856.1 hypothetical protein H696_02667 [Fonticula alba]
MISRTAFFVGLLAVVTVGGLVSRVEADSPSNSAKTAARTRRDGGLQQRQYQRREAAAMRKARHDRRQDDRDDDDDDDDDDEEDERRKMIQASAALTEDQLIDSHPPAWLFNMHDTNQDKALDMGELRRVYSGYGDAESIARTVMNEFDENRDGRLSAAEFDKALLGPR